MPATPVIALLGPQRLRPTVGEVVRRLRVDGPIAAVTAGWEEREGEDDELAEHLGGRPMNLRLFARHESMLGADAALREAETRRQRTLDTLRRLYRLRLDHAVEAGWALLRRGEDPALLEPEQAAAIEAIRAIDAHHVERVRAIEAEYEAAVRPDENAAVLEHREAVAVELRQCAGLAIAGGHVGILVHLLRLFTTGASGGRRPETVLGASGEMPVFAWSAGAMALADRVVLFHDDPPQGPSFAGVLGPGLGLVTDVLPLPHARRRLKLDDPVRVGLLARRFAPMECTAMDEGALLVHQGGAWTVREGVCRLMGDGSVVDATAEACVP